MTLARGQHGVFRTGIKWAIKAGLPALKTTGFCLGTFIRCVCRLVGRTGTGGYLCIVSGGGIGLPWWGGGEKRLST